MKSHLLSIGTAVPEYEYKQEAIAGFLIKQANLPEEERRKLQAVFRLSGIDTRYSVLPDFNELVTNKKLFVQKGSSPSVSARMQQYKEHALPLSKEAALRCLNSSGVTVEKITHLITVSCTGMYAPGLDIDLVQALGLSLHVQRTCVNFMGCYAAFNALKIADSICRADADAYVLIVCTELCSLHYQQDQTTENIISNAIFADGSAAALVHSQPVSDEGSLCIQDFHCDLFSEGHQDMSWEIGNHGFEMVLSSYVPSLIGGGIQTLTERLLQKLSLSLNEIDFYAVHPGGKKILEAVETSLSIPASSLKNSYDVFRKYGNMSSPSVLFVMKEIMDQLSENDHGKNILSFAFGPGLTLESMLIQTHLPSGVSSLEKEKLSHSL